MTLPQIRAPIVAISVFQTLALIVRAIFQQRLQAGGFDSSLAADLSYLVVPVILIIALAPVLRSNWSALAGLCSPRHLSWRLVFSAVAVGLLLRLAWWCQLVARLAFGLMSDADANAIEEPVFWFACPAPAALGIALLIWVGLLPVVEEVINRGLIQSTLRRYGHWIAVVGSALLFAFFHKPGAMAVAFLMGLVFALQYANTGTLWSTIISHATYDGVILFDWRCWHIIWNPATDVTPLFGPGITGLLCLVVAVAAIGFLVTGFGARPAPRTTC